MSIDKFYGAQMVFCIENFHEKLDDAKANKKTSIYSSPFYSHKFGYKMEICVCPCGDGKGSLQIQDDLVNSYL